jgi:predicted ATPase/class 3 adenylate cyclase
MLTHLVNLQARKCGDDNLMKKPGEKMTSGFPTGTVTFLFTDIEGSTRLWEQYPESMQAALARHDILLREIIENQDGHIIKTTGDGLHAVFGRATAALAAGLACQQALLGQVWPGLPGPLRVRMGLHTGEAEFRDGDYYGSTINRAARLMSIAAGGQTLLSSTMTGLVRDQLPQGVNLSDLGEHRLKDLTRPEHIFQLNGAGLPVDFPPLRSLNTLPNNLPLQLTSFVGREREMAEAKRLLAATRLLTLTGPGGTGKTRLSIQVAADMLDAFPAGVWLVELAPLSDPALVLQELASVLGVREQQGRPLIDTLIDYLRTKTLLLILDNCEHLIDACAQMVTILLSACPHLKILPSSREAFGVAGETAYRVPSLSLPDVHASTPEALVQSEAVRLFVERAQAAQPRFTLTTQNISAIAQICQRLDGIPLALELAAVRLRLFTVEQIATRLDDRFRLLTGGSRTALPRQQTLRALIDWSYDLLSEAERVALSRLSVFAGGWTFEAAEAVLGLDTLDLLSHLVDKSLVVAEEPSQNGERRYRLLETIRQYARDKLLESGEVPTVRDLHLDTYLRLATEAELRLEGPQMLPVLDQLETELDNIRTAMEWALERNPQATLQLAASLPRFWASRGKLTEGRRWLDDGLARFNALAPAEGDSGRRLQALKAKGLSAAGTLAFGQGELNASRTLSEESVALARAAGEQRTLVKALSMLGFVTAWLGDGEATDAVIEEALQLARTTNDKSDIALVKGLQSVREMHLYGDFAAARTFAEEALKLWRDLGDPWDIAISIMGLGAMATLQGNYSQALAHYEEGEMLFRQLGDRNMVNAMQSERAHIERRLGHYAQAVALYSKTLAGWQELGNQAALAHELECFAFIAVAQNQTQRAACLLGAAEALRESVDSPMTANERIEYDQNVATLRAQMDAQELAVAWAEGRAMTMEQAIQFALE